MLRGVVLLTLSGLAGVCAEDSCLADPESCSESDLGREDMSVMQLRQDAKPKVLKPSSYPEDRYELQGKSVYLVMTDRFNRVGGYSPNDKTECSGNDWCNGTFAGIKEQLPYIKGMGFDCIWVTPVVENPAVEDKHDTDCYGSGYAYHGYWAQNIWKTDPHYGKNSDLQELVRAVHEIGMCFVLDIVLNHMGPIHPWEPLSVSKKIPFDKPEYYHQVGRGDTTWDEFTEKYCDWPNPQQAMGPGTLCKLDVDKATGKPDYTNGGNYCNNYNPSNGPYNKTNYLGKDAAGPTSLRYCGPGDYCEGYNQELIWDGWFYDLGDLNHSHPFVVETQLQWLEWLKVEFDIDSIRLDTAPYMPWDFLAKAQEAAYPVQIHGEVTTVNISWHASFQKYKGPDGEYKVLEGLQNFPPNYAASAGFCGDAGQPSSPTAMWDLRELGRIMTEQIHGPYTCIDSLMNFIDNQDSPPLGDLCKSDVSRVKNALTWVFLMYGIPTVTWGTEQGNTVYRNSLWQYDWDTTTWQYQFIRTLNLFRKKHMVSKMMTKVVHATKHKLTFVRFSGLEEVWVLTTSKNRKGSVTYSHAPPPKPKCCRWSWWKKTCGWVDALTGKPALFKNGKLIAPSTEPMVLVASLRA